MTNNHTRKIINSFKELIDVCISDEETDQQWKQCVRMWRDLVHCVQQKYNFSDHEIEAFQSLCDLFF